MNYSIYKKMAVHRYLFETKFGDNEILPLSISPYIAEALNENLDALIDELTQINAVEDIKHWMDWRVLTKEKREFPLIKQEMDHYSGDDKLDFLKIVSSPFVISDDYLKELI